MHHVTDTHSLVWYLTEDKKLSKSALSIFTKADEGDTIIIVPTIVLAEIIHICEKKKRDLEIKNVMDKINGSMNYIPYNLNMEVLEKVIGIKDISEMHDRIITAIAIITDSTLITKDEEITKSEAVKTIW